MSQIPISNLIDFGKMPVHIQFTFDPKTDQDGCPKSKCQSEKVDKESQLVLGKAPKCDFEVVGEHTWRFV